MVPRLLACSLLDRACDDRDEQMSRLAGNVLQGRRGVSGKADTSVRRLHIGQLVISALVSRFAGAPVTDIRFAYEIGVTRS